MGKNIFNSVKMTRTNSNVFDLSHDVKLSCNMGQLVPIMVTECIPGDKFNISCESLIRMSPLVSPVMHRMDVTIHYFFVPNRILWPNWEKYITNTPDANNIPFAHPRLSIDEFNYQKIHDYMGIPTPIPGSGVQESINAFPFAAYCKVFDDFYKDQNLSSFQFIPLVDGLNPVQNYNQLFNRCWEHDYFTSALPFAQKGANVNIPLGDVTLKQNWAGTNNPEWQLGNGNREEGYPYQNNPVGPAGPSISIQRPDTSFVGPAAYNPNGSLEVGNTTINDLRKAFRLQEWLEKAARGGSRYIENILAHFGVKSSDRRLQRPEYITGVKSPIIISEVLNTSDTPNAPQGNMAGHGYGVVSGQYGNYYCEEHGYIMGIMSVMPKTAYQQGIPKHFLKFTDPFEYYWPSFANIGEQEIKQREIFAYTNTGDDVFGYIPRYSEYKYEPNRVAGDFRNSLDFWHMGRIFNPLNPPVLNDQFVTSDPTERIFAVTDPNEDKLYCHVLNKVRAVRLMPKYGNPSF